MAVFRRDKNWIEATIAVTGTRRAVERLWSEVARMAASGRGEIELIIAERPEEASDDRALRLILRRHPPPSPELAEVALLASLCADSPSPYLPQIADGLIVALDLAGETAAQARHLTTVVGNVLPLLSRTWASSGVDAPGLPVALFPHGPEQARRRLGAGWIDDAEVWVSDGVRPFVSASVVAALRHVSSRLRERWNVHRVLPDRLVPTEDLPFSMHEVGERLGEDSENEDLTPGTRAHARVALAKLYHRASHGRAAGVLLRRALAENASEGWDSLPDGAPNPHDYQLLRSWTLDPGAPGGIALDPGGNGLLVVRDETLMRLPLTDSRPAKLVHLDDPTRLIRGLPDGRVLAIGRTVQLVDPAARKVTVRKSPRVLREALERAHARAGGTRWGGPEVVLPPLRVAIDHALGRVLIVLASGALLLDLETLEVTAQLERDDLVAAAPIPSGGVLTLHRGGAIAVWEPEQGYVERLENVGASGLRDASIGVVDGVIELFVVLGTYRGGPTLRGYRLTLDDHQLSETLTVPTEEATTVRTSGDGQRVFTLERRLLRVRAADAPEPRTLLDPPPWMPTHIDIDHGGARVAVLARTLTGRAPLRVNLWG